MKVKIFAVVTLVITLGFVVVNTAVLDGAVAHFIDKVEKISIGDEDGTESARDCYEEFKRWETYIGITVNHEDLTNIEGCFSEMIGFSSVGLYDEAEAVKSRLIDSLEHLRRLVGVNIDSVI